MSIATGTRGQKGSSSGSSKSLVGVGNVAFDQSSTRSVSNEFEVRGCPVQIIAFDLADGDVIEVERVFELPGCVGIKRTVPVTSCCGTCKQSIYRNGDKFVDSTWLSAQGRYRLVYASGTPGVATVIMHEDALAVHRADLTQCSECGCGDDICDMLEDLPLEGQAQLGLIPATL